MELEEWIIKVGPKQKGFSVLEPPFPLGLLETEQLPNLAAILAPSSEQTSTHS